jgi:hypothetical protein
MSVEFCSVVVPEIVVIKGLVRDDLLWESSTSVDCNLGSTGDTNAETTVAASALLTTEVILRRWPSLERLRFGSNVLLVDA